MLKQRYVGRAHLAEMISLLGPPPLSLLAQGKSSRRFFSDEGMTATFLVNSTIHSRCLTS
jgi:hypothetical protein